MGNLQCKVEQGSETLPKHTRTSPQRAEMPKGDIDYQRLAEAVAMAETGGFKKGYGLTHTNGQGIKHGNTVPCPGVPKLAMCKFKSQQESHDAFILIWKKWYGGLPNLKKAERWTGNHNANTWLNNVLYHYSK